MSEQPAEVTLETAAVSDRGLNEKRPLNEDSYLLDAERRIFAVADGVGGAEAGEVASQTAVEVLAEAFRHHKDGDDIEDLMELAIQRANASIYQLAHEQRHFAMMATTVVALHLAGRRATFGHVGDSRLYRLAPDGTLHRETDDHSIVEEEVRAGRMTAEQAAHHPSRNVISRALGAEATVEVDMKTREVEDGTIFLLCSDGITRHIPDKELSELLQRADALEAACAEMKRLCYERGAEDNLTAVAVRVGARTARTVVSANDDDEERTILHGEPARRRASADVTETADGASLLQRPFANAGAQGGSRVVVPAPQADESKHAQANNPTRVPQERSAVGRAGSWFGVLLFVLVAAALAFYGGIRYQKARAVFANGQVTSTVAQPTPESPEARFDRERREVDMQPAAMEQRYTGELLHQEPQTNEPAFHYLYGRALLLSGKPQDAQREFAQVVQLLSQHEEKANGRDSLRIDTRIA
ncbi:MAG TPA: protein phosphatase 2C domain-containing protein, partial [Pyrinomonadaceae bacterium]|nr:protein phosphatase 2C domain-containing protein [Pyrinomonadaceae bacterium]